MQMGKSLGSTEPTATEWPFIIFFLTTGMMAVGMFATQLHHLPPFWFKSHFYDPRSLLCDQESKGGGFSSSVDCLRVAVSSLGSSSSFSQAFSDGGTAVAGGGGKRRGQGGAAAQGFSNVRQQEGVACQLQDVHAVLLVISQATSNECL